MFFFSAVNAYCCSFPWEEEWQLFSHGASIFQVCLSVILTALGVIIAAIGDFSFDLFGYTMALTSVFFQVKHLLFLHFIFLPPELLSPLFYNF